MLYTTEEQQRICNTHLYPYPLFHKENNQQPRNQSSCRTNHLHAHQPPRKRRLASSPQKAAEPHLGQHRSSKAYAAEYQHTPAEAEINSANIWISMRNQQFSASGNRPRSML
ncbi:hypothetical protein Nepgr_002717 [Nepenthes gracilis]|uniref:Uncharacterized protein n=1 Tax=Nepenthes gracilis TaxID=150966 RepID=A0AAD3P955_NEPGR|nr:hypothetical protein Nepgr_002717 [Nepenthes gracilis]